VLDGWYQWRQTVHLFSWEFFAFDIHLVSDDAALLPRYPWEISLKPGRRVVGQFSKAESGYILASAEVNNISLRKSTSRRVS
jgi:hypothetical protein